MDEELSTQKTHQHEELKLRFKPAPFLCPELFILCPANISAALI